MVKKPLRLLRVLRAALPAAAVGVAWCLLATLGLETYGLGLFVGMPFAVGLVAALRHAALGAPAIGGAIGVGVVALLLTAGALLAIAAEGAVCLVMALPLALPLVVMGAAVGYGLASRGRPSPRTFGAVAAAVPLLLGAEAGADRQPAPVAVTTRVVVHAPPEVVWRRVVAFPPLPAPRAAAFRAGVAYPVSATIEGRGVGAIRRCRFSTGDFVEPVTVWDPPHRLAFDVASQPAPLRELSPWGEVHPPHLDGFLRSRRGEFRLVALPGGDTLLEGTTWYENRMWPARYWRAWSDGVIHAIHRRVLRHVAAHAERDARALRRRAP